MIVDSDIDMSGRDNIDLEYIEEDELELGRRGREALGYEADEALSKAQWDEVLETPGLRDRVRQVLEAVTIDSGDIELEQVRDSVLKKWLLSVCSDALALEELHLEWKSKGPNSNRTES